MSKPTLVTWPFVMLLLDYWPLGRCGTSSTLTGSHAPSTVLRLVREKIPFFVGVAVHEPRDLRGVGGPGVLAPGSRLPLGARVGNAMISYCGYLGKLFWPTDLAVIYPHPMHSPLGQVVLAGGLLLGISALVLLCPAASLFADRLAVVLRDAGAGEPTGHGRRPGDGGSLELHSVARGADPHGLGRDGD